MSLITSWNRNIAKHPSASAWNGLRAIAAGARHAIARCARLVVYVADTIAEARLQRAMIEAEFYLNRYRHSSKTDDDLPIVRREQ